MRETRREMRQQMMEASGGGSEDSNSSWLSNCSNKPSGTFCSGSNTKALEVLLYLLLLQPRLQLQLSLGEKLPVPSNLLVHFSCTNC